MNTYTYLELIENAPRTAGDTDGQFVLYGMLLVLIVGVILLIDELRHTS